MARQGDRRKLAEWRQRLQRFDKSGLTVARFCARELSWFSVNWNREGKA
jgi:hypothetical protein